MRRVAEALLFFWVVRCGLMNHDAAWHKSRARLIVVQHVSKQIKSLRLIKVWLLILSLILVDGCAF